MEGSGSTEISCKKKKICIFGTSANPPTLGHRDIVAYLASLVEFDEIIVLPVYEHMFERKRCNNNSINSSSFQDRLDMAKLAFSNISSNVIVSDLERQCYFHGIKQIQQRVGTADLLGFIKSRDNCAVDYSLTLGSDTFADLMDMKWKRSNDVIDHVEGRFLIISRPTEQTEKEQQQHQLMKKLKLLNERFLSSNGDEPARLIQIPKLKCVSSTDARACSTDSTLNQIVDPAVLCFIKSKQLYAFSPAVIDPNDKLTKASGQV